MFALVPGTYRNIRWFVSFLPSASGLNFSFHCVLNEFGMSDAGSYAATVHSYVTGESLLYLLILEIII